MIAHRCPYEKDWKNARTRDFIDQKLNEFIGNFPNLDLDVAPLKGLKVLVGTGHWYTPLAFIRMHTRGGFRCAAKKMGV